MPKVEDVFQKVYQSPEYRAIHERRPDFPMIVDVEATNGCNLDCIFCQRQVMTRPVKVLQWDDYVKVVDEVAEHPPCSVRFSGWGEPTLNPRIVDMVRYAHDKGVLTHLTSNGVVMDGELARKLLDAGLDKIKFSLQGLTEGEYDRMRVARVDEDPRCGYANITKHIEEFVRVRDEVGSHCFVQVSVSMLKSEQENAEGQQAFYDRWHPIADGIWGLGAIGVYGGQPLLTSFQRVKDTGRITEEDIAQGRPLRSDDVNQGRRCAELYSKLSIGADGSIKACCDDCDNNLVVGSLADSSLKEAWDSPFLEKLRAALESGDPKRLPKFCRDCDNYF